MWGCGDVRENVQMLRMSDARLGECGDVRICGCEDVKMRGYIIA
jgi:hypothetical protein